MVSNRNDFLYEVKERQRMLSAQFAECHPVITIPGWITDRLDPVARAQLQVEEEHPYQVPRVYSPIEVPRLDTQLRLVSPHGLEIRLTPYPKGMRVQWRYHLPALGPDRPACDIPLVDWLKGHALAAKVEKAEGLVPWERLGPGPDASSHEVIEYHGVVAQALSDQDELTVRYIPIDLVEGLLLRLPGCDLMIGTEKDQALRLSRSDHFDGPFVNRLLSKNMRLLCSISSATLHQAASRLNKETRRAPLKYHLQTKLQNGKAIGRVMVRDIRRLLGRWLPTGFNKKENPT